VTALHHVPIGAAALPGDREVDVLSDYAVPSSFPVFYAVNFRRAVALAIVLTGSTQAAEDLVQDAMADAHRRWKKISAYENPSSWLNRAIVNRSVSLRRRLMSRERGNAVLAASGEPTAEIDARDAELWSKVRKLPARQAQLVALVYVHRLTLAKVPASFLNGAHGTEIVMTQIDDGDGDPRTITLDAGPAGQVKLYPGSAETTATTAFSSVTTLSGAAIPQAPIEGTCLETASGGLCPINAGDEPEMMIAPRSDHAAVTVYGLPSKVVAVAFTSGTERYWTRPFQGVVVFPFSEAASHEVRTEAYAADDTIIRSFENVSDELTTAEIAAQAVTTQTDETLATGWFVPNYTPLAPTAMGEFARYRGRTSKTGFTGPFTAQGVSICTDECPTDRGIWIVTVNSSSSDEVRTRLEVLGGKLRTIEPAAGATVFVWSETSSPKDRVDAIVAAMTSRVTDKQFAQLLDAPRTWGEFGPPSGQAVIDAILGEKVGELDGHAVVAQSDDLGIVQFRSRIAPQFAIATSVGGARFAPAIPAVGSVWFPTLYAVPGDVTGLTVSLSDGSIVRPTLLDVRPLAPTRLFSVAGDPNKQSPTITKVEVTRA
jgi:DNA-directed RNA polymerase specialized sigma24 family protein